MTAAPSAPPSTGSVPPPTSSSSTSAGSSSARSIATMLAMCAENVLRLAAIDCSSPMSAKTVRNGVNRLPGSTGISRPACAISASRPNALSATVLPPVFGPGDDERARRRHDRPGRRRPTTATSRAGRARRSAVAHRRNQQRMPRAAELEPAVVGERRRDAVARAARARPSRAARRARRRRRACASSSSARARNAFGQRQQNAPDLLLLALGQRDDVVVERDRRHRLEVQARAARRAAVHDARNRVAMFGADDDDVAAVAVGDDLVLQVLRRVAAARQRVERRAQLRALAAQRLANVAQRRARAVADVAGGIDRAPDRGGLVRERRRARRDRRAARRGRRRRLRGAIAPTRRLSTESRSAPGRASCSGSSGWSSTSSAASMVVEIVRRAKASEPPCLTKATASVVSAEPRCDLVRVGRRLERERARPAERRQRFARQRLADPIELERSKTAACMGRPGQRGSP